MGQEDADANTQLVEPYHTTLVERVAESAQGTLSLVIVVK